MWVIYSGMQFSTVILTWYNTIWHHGFFLYIFSAFSSRQLSSLILALLLNTFNFPSCTARPLNPCQQFMKQWNAKHLLILIKFLTSKKNTNMVTTFKYAMFEKYQSLQGDTTSQNLKKSSAVIVNTFKKQQQQYARILGEAALLLFQGLLCNLKLYSPLHAKTLHHLQLAELLILSEGLSNCNSPTRCQLKCQDKHFQFLVHSCLY